MSVTEELSQRARLVLAAVIAGYITTAEPVGSRTISKLTDLTVSPAMLAAEFDLQPDPGDSDERSAGEPGEAAEDFVAAAGSQVEDAPVAEQAGSDGEHPGEQDADPANK